MDTSKAKQKYQYRESGKPWELKPFCGKYKLLWSDKSYEELLKEIGFTEKTRNLEKQCDTYIEIRTKGEDQDDPVDYVRTSYKAFPMTFTLGLECDYLFEIDVDGAMPRKMQNFAEFKDRPFKLCLNYVSERRDQKEFTVIHEFQGDEVGDKMMCMYVCEDILAFQQYEKVEAERAEPTDAEATS